jgi:hypothetical protein
VNYKTKALLIGGVAGAVLGAALAWAASDDDEQEESAVSSLGPSDYFALGISLLTLARQFSNMLK